MLRIPIVVAALILSGCQHLPEMPDIKELTSGGMRFSYHGKELPSQFFRDHHKHRNSGLQYRGYNRVQRHYF